MIVAGFQKSLKVNNKGENKFSYFYLTDVENPTPAEDTDELLCSLNIFIEFIPYKNNKGISKGKLKCFSNW